MKKKTGNGTAKKGLTAPNAKKPGSTSKPPKGNAKKAPEKTTVIQKDSKAKKSAPKKTKTERNPNNLGPQKITKLEARKTVDGHQFKNFGDFQKNLSRVYAFHFYAEQAIAAKDGNIAVGNGYKILLTNSDGTSTVITGKINKRSLEAAVAKAEKSGAVAVQVGMGFNHTHSLAHYVKGDYSEAVDIRFTAVYWTAAKVSPKAKEKNTEKPKKNAGKAKKKS